MVRYIGDSHFNCDEVESQSSFNIYSSLIVLPFKICILFFENVTHAYSEFWLYSHLTPPNFSEFHHISTSSQRHSLHFFITQVKLVLLLYNRCGPFSGVWDVIFLHGLGPGTLSRDDEDWRKDRQADIGTEKLGSGCLGSQLEKAQYLWSLVYYIQRNKEAGCI